ncbi:MAG: glycosyltransferase family 4 protein [Terriglobales bacterium]
MPCALSIARGPRTGRAARLLFVSGTPANVRQGSGTYVGVATLAQGLERLGHQVELRAPARTAGLWRRLWFNWRLDPAEGYDAVVGVDLDGLWLPRGRAPIAAIKGVLAEEARFERGWTRFSLELQARLEARRARRAACVLVPSAYAAGAVRGRYGVRPEHIHVIPECIDLAGWQALLATAPTRPASRPVVLCVAHLYPRKDVATLLRAIATVDADCELRVVGIGPELDRLRRLAARLGLGSRVRFCGHVARAALAAEYRAADIFCLPSRQEAFGIVLLEAMAAGLPIVAARAAAIPELVHDQHNGRLYPPGDERALAALLNSLLASPQVRLRLAENGRRAVERYDAPRIAAQFLRALGLDPVSASSPGAS